MIEPTQKDIDRFWSKVIIRGGDCWEWTAGKSKNGYGQFALGGKMVGAHRMSWALEHGRWPEGNLCICHLCDNPSCCNPSHLWLGTIADNMHDRDSKDRQADGEQNGMAKLTEVDVLEIREHYSAGDVTQQELADEFGVDQSHISLIVRKKIWRHL